MTLTLTQVEHIANLARLELTAEEKERFREQLSEILDYFAQLQSVETSGILPSPGALSGQSQAEPLNRLRPDEPHTGLTLEELLGNAAQVDTSQFRVPPVLDLGEQGD